MWKIAPISVFLVDDHPIFLDGLNRLLSNEPDIKIIGVAHSGVDALDKIRNELPQVVVLDVAMPDMKGIELTKVLRKQHPEIHIMVLSMYVNSYIVSEFISAGVKAYVLKDCSLKELLLGIRSISGGGMYFCPQLVDMIQKDYRKIMDAQDKNTEVPLSDRELEVLKLLLGGKKINEIESILHISKNTVNTHRSRIMAKLNCNSMVDLIRYSIRKGIFEMDHEG